MFTDIYVTMQGAGVLQERWRVETAQAGAGWLTTLIRWASLSK